MTSESTRFFGQPSETKPIFGLAASGLFWDSLDGWISSVEGELTKGDFSRFCSQFQTFWNVERSRWKKLQIYDPGRLVLPMGMLKRRLGGGDLFDEGRRSSGDGA
jgi:hypothetical protein